MTEPSKLEGENMKATTQRLGQIHTSDSITDREERERAILYMLSHADRAIEIGRINSLIAALKDRKSEIYRREVGE